MLTWRLSKGKDPNKPQPCQKQSLPNCDMYYEISLLALYAAVTRDPESTGTSEGREGQPNGVHGGNRAGSHGFLTSRSLWERPRRHPLPPLPWRRSASPCTVSTAWVRTSPVLFQASQVYVPVSSGNTSWIHRLCRVPLCSKWKSSDSWISFPL